MSPIDQLNETLDRLTSFEAGPFPVVSLYLDLRPDEHGRDRFDQFLRKELGDRLRTCAEGTPERTSLEQDAAKIAHYTSGVDPALNGPALFSCSGANLFEALALTRIVRDEGIDRIVLAGDDVIVPPLREQSPKDVAASIVDVLTYAPRSAKCWSER
jgi:hypothetical protein